jgi:uncharacterized membrane protein YbhN (UPF0104 family)
VRLVAGLMLFVLAAGYLAGVAEAGALTSTLRSTLDAPLLLTVALACYAAAFGLRAWAWTRVLPGLPRGQSWAALHVAALGNHLLPLRLGEVLRVTSVLRRTDLPAAPVTASGIGLRLTDVLAILGLAALAAPALLADVAGRWLVPATAVLVLAAVGALVWVRRLSLPLPGPAVVTATVMSWALEACVVWAVAYAAGFPLSPLQAIAVTAVTVAAQTVAVTPGGVGSYEAAATVTLAAVGVPAATALGVALVTHAVKTAYALVVGGVALFVPAPSYWGRFRLPRRLPERAAVEPIAPDAPVVVMIPAYDEEATVGSVVRRLPVEIAGRPVVTLVIDDGSTDRTAARAAAAGAEVIRQPANRGLGAAVRRGLAESVARRPAAVVYLDADGEYAPEEVPLLAGPVLAGAADYVIGSRFRGEIRSMRPHRRVGNLVLTAWLRWLTRRRGLTDGQSGFRAFSPAAAADAEVVHDYNYAQVLTLDLLGKGYTYAEVPISYAFRQTGTSFVRLGRYLRRVVPAVHRELNATTETAHPSLAYSPAPVE